MTVRMNTDALDSAISAVEELANDIANARTACINAVPYRGPSLPSLTGGSVTVTAPEWLREQKTDPLGVVLDLARLLDTEGDGTVVWTGSTDGSIQDIKEELGRQIAARAEDLEDIDSPEDLDAFLETLGLLDTYAEDPDVTGAFVTAIGPEGLNQLIQRAGSMTGPYAEYPNPNGIYEDSSYGEEFERIVAMQDTLAETLSQSVATASLAGKLPDDFGSDFVRGGDPRSAAILFDYAARGGHEFGSEFLVSAGDALLEWENGEGGMYWSNFPGGDQQYGTADLNALRDPTVAWMEALSLSTEGSQEVLLDTDRAAYLLERFSPMEDVNGEAAGKVLQTATVDQALDPGDRGRDAATISSWAIEHFGGDAEPPDGIKEELGGILGVYIYDVYEAIPGRGLDIEPGTYVRPPGDRGDGWPVHGITINNEDLRGLLGDIGDNDSAVSIIGSAANNYNQVRIDDAVQSAIADGGQVGGDDPITMTTGTNAANLGFLYDGLLEGGISSAEDDAAQRRRMAELLLLPTNAIDVPGGPVGTYVVGEIKKHLTNEFVGDGVNEAITGANDVFTQLSRQTWLQTFETMLTAEGGDQLDLGDARDQWPTNAAGNPIPTEDLSDQEVLNLILAIQDGDGGYASTALSEAAAQMERHLDRYGVS
ncbi:hypothetical protein BHE97_05575 [Aeromicrobium sp. PE09-221]|uniref:hypothetical protein n=1 Tax=Aeromicrobium sp. PE09-221 TaxID=1898043 RepID=UPI000B3EB1D6|nr:hypothetical protein [Aeromicrobium sp. PE09-221]OUZ11304.1 hypothetical protein BHE97_05575 [Aeromicrobium sp. PE09-221]